MIIVDTSENPDGLPEVGQAKACERSDCPSPEFEIGFGLAGGGYGPYEFCTTCGKVVSKTQERDG